MGRSTDDDLDQRVRLSAIAFLEDQVRLRGDVLPHDVLRKGFVFDGRRVPLLGPQGIFKPAVLPEMPLTIATAPVVEGRPRPYDDAIGPDQLLRYRYRYRGSNARHRDNVSLREAMRRGAPLIYLFGLVPGLYAPQWPAYVVEDSPDLLCFTVAIDDRRIPLSGALAGADLAAQARRAYVTVETQRRLHQQSFRLRVLRAYREHCAVCRLRHEELLEAAHILPDTDPRGAPIVPNGLALCKLHHAAFDRNLLGIRPDLVVQLRTDILTEDDGPMLEHGLQGFQGARICVPRAPHLRPNRAFLDERYETFRKAV